MKNSSNLIINGSGSYPGGHYEKISIRGEGNIVNDIDCSIFRVYGTSEARENVKTRTAKILGEAEVKGNVEAKEMLVMGTMTIGGKAKLEKMRIFGTLEVEDSLYGDTAIIKGGIKVKGNVEYEKFDSSGGFEIKGLLSADTVKIVMSYGDSFAEEIGGGKITVKKGSWLIPFTNISLSKRSGYLDTKTIEGDEIYLENTKAGIVRGNKVEIGPGCEIGLVEYRTDLSHDPRAIIKTKTKI
ncbi:cytoplasmic protein [Neobacillus terrae]|uniref:cytoplasmic protein n=1 Tax=Neobacillus terrae TaxID=3034837 RepID=UPI00140BB881|nr:cytoplasmic protein [Neobacillus terrae]NHM30955.1 cytoplasmic protein [Neobacillus terrae]